MLIGETFHQEGKLSTYRLYTYKGHVCRGSAEGYPIHLQREPSRDCEESVKKNNQKCVVNFRTVYFLCFVKRLHLVNFQIESSNPHDFGKTSAVMMYTNSNTVARKSFSFRSKTIAKHTEMRTFFLLLTVPEFFHVITALVFSVFTSYVSNSILSITI